MRTSESCFHLVLLAQPFTHSPPATTRKMVPIIEQKRRNEFDLDLIWIDLSCVVATIFSSLAFLSSSVSMAYLGRLIAASLSGLALLSSSVSTANLICISK